jgi:hypothetical protein
METIAYYMRNKLVHSKKHHMQTINIFSNSIVTLVRVIEKTPTFTCADWVESEFKKSCGEEKYVEVIKNQWSLFPKETELVFFYKDFDPTEEDEELCFGSIYIHDCDSVSKEQIQKWLYCGSVGIGDCIEKDSCILVVLK